MGEVGAVRDEACQWALTRRRTLGIGSALQRGHRAALEPLTQRNDALSVGNKLALIAVSVVIAPTNPVALETAREGWEGDGERVGVLMGTDTKTSTLGRRRT